MSAQERCGILDPFSRALIKSLWAFRATLPFVRSSTPPAPALVLFTGSSAGAIGVFHNADWHVSLGDMELTDEEMEKLVRSKSGLVKLRGEWVLADGKDLSRTKQYMKRLQRSSADKARLEAV